MLTDNEKAATFIGWAPGRHLAVGTACGSVRTVAHGPTSPNGRTWSNQPDMSDPRNYMRALAEREYGWFILRYDSGRYSCLAGSGDDKYTEWGDSPAEAAVKALAALYDAEHEEDAVDADNA